MTTGTPRADHDADVLPPPRRDRRVVAAATFGTIVEGYDLALFGVFAAILAPAVFFPGTDPATGIVAGVSTFVLAFVARPIGALVFGPIGDRLGRRTALIATLAIMGTATIGIGRLPGYASIGLAAPVALSVLRFAQGIAPWAGSGPVRRCSPWRAQARIPRPRTGAGAVRLWRPVSLPGPCSLRPRWSR